jgi:hypothetical protein
MPEKTFPLQELSVVAADGVLSLDVADGVLSFDDAGVLSLDDAGGGVLSARMDIVKTVRVSTSLIQHFILLLICWQPLV